MRNSVRAFGLIALMMLAPLAGCFGEAENGGGSNDDVLKIDFQPAGDGVFGTYNECYESYIKEGEANFPDSGDEEWKEFVQNGGFDFLESIEEEFDCAGICYSPLFYMTKDISNAPVTQGCVEAFIERAKGT